jgi:hypothetical protein
MDGVKDGNETDVDCGGLDCDLLGKVCGLGQSCSIDQDCATEHCQAGVCAKKPDGLPCSSDFECVNGHCVNNTLCCHTACAKQLPSSCGTNGLCADDGASCQVYGAGTTCGTPSCIMATVNSNACDGAGTCVIGPSAPCPGHFSCFSPTACYTSCQADSACAPGFHCVMSTGLCM